MKIRLDIAAQNGGPAIASLLAQLLTEAGATVIPMNPRTDTTLTVQSPVKLGGLTVYMDRVTQVSENETERWSTNETTSDELRIGDEVKIAEGATAWMKRYGYWLDGWPESIDGMTMNIIADYTHLGGNGSHWWVENEIVKDCGVNPRFIIKQST